MCWRTSSDSERRFSSTRRSTAAATNCFTVWRAASISPSDISKPGTAILFKVPRVVIGENRTFMGAEDWMRANGAELVVVDDARCIALMEWMKREKPDLRAEGPE